MVHSIVIWYSCFKIYRASKKKPLKFYESLGNSIELSVRYDGIYIMFILLPISYKSVRHHNEFEFISSDFLTFKRQLNK